MFSCILVSDGERSYVLLKYNNINWTEAPVKNDSTNTTLPAWLGFSAGDGIRYTSITDTFSISVDDVSFTSNINQSGVWIFRVDGNSTISGGKPQSCTYLQCSKKAIMRNNIITYTCRY